MNTTFIVWATAASAAQIFIALYLLWVRRRPTRLDEVDVEPRDVWPRLSIVIPAKNEEATIADALTTVLRQSYPNLEIILVDDRSTDRTGLLMDAVASGDARVRVLHIEDLPDGWLGKVHALHRGTSLATGDFILFTDADVHFGESALERAVDYCERNGFDFMSIVPFMETHGLLFEASMVAFGTAYTMATKSHQIGKEGSDAYAGVGAFNLVRASTFSKSDGFEWLRLEIADDVGVGLLMQRVGARACLLIGGDMVRIDWYPSVRAMVAGLEKNAFAVTGRFSRLRVALLLVVMATWTFGPLAAAAQGSVLWLAIGGVTALSLTAVVNVQTGRWFGVGAVPSAVSPVGIVVMMFALLRSAAICSRADGVRWRDTWYPIAELRAAQRVKL